VSDAPDAGGARLRRFLAEDVWNPELSSLSGLRHLMVRTVRVGHLVMKGFREDDLPVHSAALTFSTLMSLVPLLAIAFAVLKGLGAAPEALGLIRDATTGMPEGFRAFVETILDSVMRTTLTTLGWVGVVVLFVTVVQTLSGIETSFNRVWGVERPRSWWRRITNYISMTVVVPVLIMAAFAIHATLHNARILDALGQAAPLYRRRCCGPARRCSRSGWPSLS
jgi:membrane protein